MVKLLPPKDVAGFAPPNPGLFVFANRLPPLLLAPPSAPKPSAFLAKPPNPPDAAPAFFANGLLGDVFAFAAPPNAPPPPLAPLVKLKPAAPPAGLAAAAEKDE